jgi:mannose-6-phosphate isomerase-like protein (cupin superfamily)
MAERTPFVGSIERISERNDAFRRVLYTGSRMQLVAMSLRPREDIGSEVHHRTDQFFRIEEGSAILTVDGKRYRLRSGDAALVPAGSRHNILNSSRSRSLKLYTLYAPPEHRAGTIHRTKAEAKRSKR